MSITSGNFNFSHLLTSLSVVGQHAILAIQGSDPEFFDASCAKDSEFLSAMSHELYSGG